MSNTARPKTAGELLSADEVNKDLPIVLNAGETIDGATLPVAVFVLNADGEVYACDGNDTAKLEFIGFAVSNSTNGNPIQIQKDGVVSGFSSLTIGAKYYVQDDKTIGTSMGTYEVLVGIAISATQILIIKGSFEYIGNASVNPDGTTTTAVPAGTRKVVVIAFRDHSGDSTTGYTESGGQLALMKGYSQAVMSIVLYGAQGGGVSPKYHIFRATWTPGAITMTAKTFTEENNGTETVVSYTITAYFYR